jgi:hypothetical protein
LFRPIDISGICPRANDSHSLAKIIDSASTIGRSLSNHSR